MPEPHHDLLLRAREARRAMLAAKRKEIESPLAGFDPLSIVFWTVGFAIRAYRNHFIWRQFKDVAEDILAIRGLDSREFELDWERLQRERGALGRLPCLEAVELAVRSLRGLCVELSAR